MIVVAAVLAAGVVVWLLSRKPHETSAVKGSPLYPSAAKRDPEKYVLLDLVSQFPWSDLSELSMAKRTAILHYTVWWAVEAIRDTVEREEHLIQTVIDNLHDDPDGMKWRVWLEELLAGAEKLRNSCETALPEFGDAGDRKVERLLIDRKPV